MKIIAVTNLFPDAGQPTLGIHNARLLHALAQAHEVRVIALRQCLPWKRGQWSPRTGDAPLQPRFVRTSYVPCIGSRANPSLYALALRRPLSVLHRDFRADVILAPWLFPDACAMARITRVSGVPLVGVGMGTDVHQYRHDPVRLKTMQRDLRGCRIITRSKQLAHEVDAMGIPGATATPIYNGVDLDTFHPGDKLEARKRLGLPADAPVLLFVGKLSAIKQPVLAARAVAQLRGQAAFSGAKLVMVGQGELRATLQGTPGNGDWLTLPGQLPPERICQYMQAADALLVTSRNEGVPNVMREAFACGCPAVATHVGGIPELMTQPFLGGTCQPEPAEDMPARFAEAIALCLRADHPAVRIRAHAEAEYSWQRCREAYTQVLEAAVRE